MKRETKKISAEDKRIQDAKWGGNGVDGATFTTPKPKKKTPPKKT